MTEAIDLEKTAPVKILESRRAALIKWIADGQARIKQAEETKAKHQAEAIEMLAEIDELEAALNKLQAIDKADLEKATDE